MRYRRAQFIRDNTRVLTTAFVVVESKESARPAACHAPALIISWLLACLLAFLLAFLLGWFLVLA